MHKIVITMDLDESGRGIGVLAERDDAIPTDCAAWLTAMLASNYIERLYRDRKFFDLEMEAFVERGGQEWMDDGGEEAKKPRPKE